MAPLDLENKYDGSRLSLWHVTLISGEYFMERLNKMAG